MDKTKLRLRRFLSLDLTVILIAAAAPITLRQSAERVGVLVGTAVRPYALSQPAYSATLAREYNIIEPEDAMKWWVLRQKKEAFDFSQGDQIVAFAEAHAMRVRGHCLVWDHNNPRWLSEGGFTSDQMSQLLYAHITTVMKHYAGRVFAWDVVNEALDEKGEFKNSPWYNEPGIGLAGKGAAYVEQAFRWAREADPKALLFYNEAEGESLNRKSDAIYAMVQDFKKRGVPIDGVGMQLHISNLNFDGDPIVKNIARLTALGLQVQITELDVSLPMQPDGSVLHDNLLRQAEIYGSVVHACLQNRGCTAIQTWGFTDKYSWIGSHSQGTRGAALPFDVAYKPKPAYDAIVEEFSRIPDRRNR